MLGNIDIFFDYFLFKFVFKFKEGLKLIYKNKKFSYIWVRECMLLKFKFVMGNVNIGFYFLWLGGVIVVVNFNVNEWCWKKYGRWVLDLFKDGYVKDSLESRFLVLKNLGLW